MLLKYRIPAYARLGAKLKKFGFHFRDPRVHLLLSDVHPRRVLLAEELDGLDVVLTVFVATTCVIATHATYVYVNGSRAFDFMHPMERDALL